MSHETWAVRYDLLSREIEDRGSDIDAVEAALKAQRVETPSWGYADSGTRFGAFPMPGAPRNIREKLADAAQANRYTGIAPSVAVHIPWDKVDNWAGLARHAESLGVAIGSINPNLFQEADYRFGSLASPRVEVRKKGIAHVAECVEIMRATGSKSLSIWLADGTNFPGQDDFRARKGRLADSLAEIHAMLAADEMLLLEYKPFEPAFYHTDLADWGMAYAHCRALGPNAKVLVDLGHHLHGANIEQIVAFLIDEGRLGGFHFNNRKYADDDLTSGSINPYELFLIFVELVKAERDGLSAGIAYMIDESHTLKNKIEEMIQSLVALQTAYAKALILDFESLEQAQKAEDLVAAEEIVKDAFAMDLRPLLWKVRTEMGLPDASDPMTGFRMSGYAERMAKERPFTNQPASGLGA